MDNNNTVNVDSKLTEPRVWGSGSTVLQVGNAIADEQNAIRRKHDEESKENWSGSIPPKKAYLILGIFEDSESGILTGWYLCDKNGEVYNTTESILEYRYGFIDIDSSYLEEKENKVNVKDEIKGRTIKYLIENDILAESMFENGYGCSFSWNIVNRDDVYSYILEGVLPNPTLQLAPLEIGGDNKRIVYYWDRPVFFTIDGQSSPECGVISEEDAQTYVNQKVPMENWDNMYTLPADEFLVKETGDPLEDEMPDKLIADQWTATLISEPIVVHS